MSDTEDYRKGYRDGWKDALDHMDARDQTPLVPGGRPAPPIPPSPPRYTPNTCSICGMIFSGMFNYSCPHPDCLSRPKYQFGTIFTD